MFKFLKNTVKTQSQILSIKAILSMIHAVERVVNKDALNLTGMTPHTVIYEDDLLSVLHYHPLEEDEIKIGEEYFPVSRQLHKTPLVYIPPLLAPGFAFDLFPERSLARYFLAKGFDVYLVDFGTPTKSHAHLSFEDYILNWMPASMEAIRSESGAKKLSLYGYCMGGLFCLLYTAIFQDSDIRNMVTVASPIDTHQMGVAGKALSLVAVPAHKLARRINFSLRDIKPEHLHVPGLLGTIGFHVINPLGVLKSYWDLLLNLWDRDYVTAHESLGHWINNLLDYPGATVQEIVIQMALANKLARKGEMTIGGRRAKLKGINCSLLSFAGEKDEIVQFESARKIMDVVSSQDKSFQVVPGGHVGLIIGEKAPQNLWKSSADWLARRSG
ncbi:MAG: alpha/beta fold hydrolase [Desulfobacteraceae bacterium]|nr:alpha/beta fold hydrolase [Desulfobacteraceae bacterium]MBC2757085.1 alpha/beta fold hydrolase [Desulfobacteraceae bacterium]MBC2763698.1 alpha/beta fold hydrolase [ANME-2 cluster archaeon]